AIPQRAGRRPPPLRIRDGGRRSMSDDRKAAQDRSVYRGCRSRAPTRHIRGTSMTALRKPRAGLEPRASHRTYRDPDPTHTVICKLIDNQADLLRLAAGIDRVELRQAPGTGWI